MHSRWKWLTTGVLFLAGMLVGASWPWASAQQQQQAAGEQPAEAGPAATGPAAAPPAQRAKDATGVDRAAKNWTEERLKIVKQPDDKTYELTISFPSDDHPQRTTGASSPPSISQAPARATRRTSSSARPSSRKAPKPTRSRSSARSTSPKPSSPTPRAPATTTSPMSAAA